MKRLLFLCCMALLVGCKAEVNEDSIKVIKADVSQVDNERAVFTDYSYIKLETRDDCLLENVVKVKVTDNAIYLLSFYGGNVYKFSKDGHFIWKLSKGEGPGELIFPSDIGLDEADHSLLVLDNYRTIKRYSPEGTFLGEIQSGLVSFLFEKQDDTYMFFDPNLTKSSRHYFNVLKNGERAFSGLPIKEETKVVSFSPSSAFVETGVEGEYYVQHMLSDTIYRYQIHSNRLEPVFYIDTDGRSVNSRDITFTEPRSFQQICKRENLIPGISGLALLNGKLYLRMYFKEKQWYIVHDMQEQTTITTNRLCHGLPNSLNCVGREKDFVVYSYRPEELYDKEDELGEVGMALLQEVKEDDNPILVLFNE